MLTEIGVIIACNLIIDPFGDFNLANIPRVNQEKIASSIEGRHQRRTKANELATGEYNAIILGTSRALTAIDPSHNGLKANRVYNLALSGSNIYEIYQVYEYANAQQKLDKVIFSLDFLTFSEKRKESGDFKLSRFSTKADYWSNIATNYLTWDTFKQSIKTVKGNFQGEQHQKSLGFLPRTNKINNYRQAFDMVLARNFFINEESYAGYVYIQHRLDLFRAIVADCLARDTTLYLYISPVHARQLEAISAMGLFPIYEQWKLDLVEIVSEEAEKANKPPPKLWDFGEYNSITTEPIPNPNTKQMRWYRESSHYTEELGDLILNILFSDERSPHFLDFGTKLSPQNIQQHLADIRQRQQNYRQQNPFEISEIHRLLNTRN